MNLHIKTLDILDYGRVHQSKMSKPISCHNFGPIVLYLVCRQFLELLDKFVSRLIHILHIYI